MKKAIFLFGLMAIVSANVKANEIIRMPVTDHVVVTNMDHVFEIKTSRPKFDQVVLDCQSFITGMNFIVGDEIKNNVYIDMFQCDELISFLDKSKEENLPVCLGLDTEYNELLITRESADECF